MKNIVISKELKAGPNNNVLVIGAAGTGKSYSYVLPNILNATGSYVINDPGGYLYSSTGKHLRDNGYAVHLINLIDIDNSESYNPLMHIKDDDGIITLVKIILEQTESPYHLVSSSDSLKKAEQYLLGACIGFLLNECRLEYRTFENVLVLLNCGKNDLDYEQTTLDILFSDCPDNIYRDWYNEYKKESKENAQTIIESLLYRLKIFFNDTLKRFTETNTFDFATIGQEKTAVFCITSRYDSPYKFLAHILYRQIYDNLIYENLHNSVSEEDKTKERLPVHFILDEFEQFGKLSNINGILMEAPEHNISFSFVVQALEQLKAVYEDWLQIVNRCDIKVITGNTTELTTSVLNISPSHTHFLKRGEGIVLIEDKEPQIMKMSIPNLS